MQAYTIYKLFMYHNLYILHRLLNAIKLLATDAKGSLIFLRMQGSRMSGASNFTSPIRLVSTIVKCIPNYSGKGELLLMFG
jgi:hypothetical protein